MRLSPIRAAAIAAAVAAGALASWAAADGVPTNRPSKLVVGAPRGHAPSDRLDPWRLGRSSVALPESPRELWRLEVPGGLDLPPVVDEAGVMRIALVSPEVMAIGPDKQRLWRTRLGTSPVVAPPVLTSDGSLALVCGDGTLWSLDAAGHVRFSVELRARTRTVVAAPLALDEGSVIVAGEQQLVEVAGDGAVRRSADIQPRKLVGGLLPYERGVVAVADDGTVLAWQPPESARVLGTFGGAVEDAVLLEPRTLAAVVDREAVVALDLATGSQRVLVGDGIAAGPLEGPVVLDRKDVLLVTSELGELFGFDRHGVMVRRGALENAAFLAATDGGALPSLFRRGERRPSPPLVLGADGGIAFLRASGRVGVADASGRVAEASVRVCSRPMVLLPAGPRRLLVACRGGTLAAFGDAP